MGVLAVTNLADLYGKRVLVSRDTDGRGRWWWAVQVGSVDGEVVPAEEVHLRDVRFVISGKRLAARLRHPVYAGAIGFAEGTLVKDSGPCPERVRFSQPKPPAPIDPEKPPRFLDEAGEWLREAEALYGDRDCIGWVRCAK